MTPTELTDFLIAEIQISGQTTFVDNLLDAAKAKIAAGGGQIAPFKTGSLSGKNFERDIRMDAVQVAICCRTALDAADPDGDSVAGTTLDFSQVGGWN
jgi:hypothetical protein